MDYLQIAFITLIFGVILILILSGLLIIGILQEIKKTLENLNDLLASHPKTLDKIQTRINKSAK